MRPVDRKKFDKQSTKKINSITMDESLRSQIRYLFRK